MTTEERLSFANEILNRRVDALESDVSELERENAGLRSALERAREQNFALADIRAFPLEVP